MGTLMRASVKVPLVPMLKSKIRPVISKPKRCVKHCPLARDVTSRCSLGMHGFSTACLVPSMVSPTISV